MHKQPIFFLILSLVLLLCGCSVQNQPLPEETLPESDAQAAAMQTQDPHRLRLILHPPIYPKLGISALPLSLPVTIRREGVAEQLYVALSEAAASGKPVDSLPEEAILTAEITADGYYASLYTQNDSWFLVFNDKIYSLNRRFDLSLVVSDELMKAMVEVLGPNVSGDLSN